VHGVRCPRHALPIGAHTVEGRSSAVAALRTMPVP
jgi:hypothetical protein